MIFLEQDHLWVQWIFPTKEQSKYNKEGPVLNSEMITEIKSSLETKMPIAFERIASFYALSNHWINPSNHNY